MSARSAQALELREDVFADTDLSARLKLFALAAIHLWETAPVRRQVKEFPKEPWPIRALRLMGETGTTEEVNGTLRWLIYDDVPKYRLDRNPKIPCVGTMLRPAGAPCRKRYTISSTIPHPFTGERTWHGACSDPRHRAIYEAAHRDAWAAWRANGEPQPKPNSGGLLLRYFTSGIEALYAWADEAYTRGDRVPEPPTQKLAVVINLDDRRKT